MALQLHSQVSAMASANIPSSSPCQLLRRDFNPLLRHNSRRSSLVRSRPSCLPVLASYNSSKESVLHHFHERRVIKIISGLLNFDRENVAAVVTAADKGGATHVDIACDPELVQLALTLTSLPICVSSVNPADFLLAVEAGAHMVEIGNYDSFYEMGRVFSSEQISNIASIWFLSLFLSIFATGILEMRWSGVGIDEWWRNEQFWVIGGVSAHLFAVVQGLLKVLAGIDTNFTVTSKASDEDGDFAELYMFKWTTLLIPPTTLLIVNLVGVVAGISYAINSGYQSWGPLFGKLFFAFWVIVHLEGFDGAPKQDSDYCGCLVHSSCVHLLLVVG